MTVLTLILVMTVQMVGHTQKAWTRASASVERFRDARVAFEAVTRRASQAVLNTYWDYDNVSAPTKFIRQSELHFISGPRETLLGNNSSGLPGQSQPGAPGYGHAVFFQAPLGYVSALAYTSTNTLLNKTGLNACGYFLDYATDTSSRPKFLQNNPAVPARTRYCVFEYREPSEQLSVYLDNYLGRTYASSVAANSAPPTLQYQSTGSVSTSDARKWYTDDLKKYSRVIAENVVALVISPRYPGLSINGSTVPDFAYAPEYFYDSRGLLSKLQETKITSIGNTLDAATTNVLPPVLDVTMVALDEASAARYEALHPGVPPLTAAAQGSPSGATGGRLFQSVSSKGSNYSTGDTDDQFETDLATFESYLTSQNLSYQVFRTSVPVRAAKFSTQ